MCVEVICVFTEYKHQYLDHFLALASSETHSCELVVGEHFLFYIFLFHSVLLIDFFYVLPVFLSYSNTVMIAARHRHITVQCICYFVLFFPIPDVA